MGRSKLEIKKIENSTNRKVTFSKRKNGLLKKAYEMSVLCDIEIALLFSSPSGRLAYFSGEKRNVEDVFARFAYLTDEERENALAPHSINEEHPFGLLENKGNVMRSLEQLRQEATTTELEEIWQEIHVLLQQLQVAQENLRMYEPDLTRITSIEEIESHEKHLQDLLNRVVERKNYLMSRLVHSENYSTAFQVSKQKETSFTAPNENAVSFDGDIVDWLPDDGHGMQAFGSHTFN